ncbi:hypothetical protein [Spiroplasma endosymbiont of Colias croceus]|uniref:hypothetical protein n=1 Tax=Spiroplasma endosymbiont of Colias croceus TaxID=3066310 RepID=UPI0030CB475F
MSKVIVNTNLGFISDNSENTILQSLKEINPELDINQIYIKKIDDTNGSAEVYSKENSNYIGKKLIKFETNLSKESAEFKNLKDIIKNTDLGLIPNTFPSIIKNRLKEINPELDIKDIYISKIYQNNVEIKSEYYSDTIVVTFISSLKPPDGEWKNKKINLNKIMKIPMQRQKKNDDVLLQFLKIF